MLCPSPGRLIDRLLLHLASHAFAHSLLAGGCSFTASTLVTTEQGKEPIGKLHIGEKVLAYNPNTKQMEDQPILHVFLDHDNDLVDLTLTTIHRTQQGRGVSRQSEVIHTNKKHPFRTKEKGFLPVGQIKLGMHVRRADGQWGLVTGWKVVPGTQVMYNLEVARDHTFTVGVGEWVVHNCSSLPELAQTRAEEIGSAIYSQIGSWGRQELTVGGAAVENGDQKTTRI